MTMWHSDSDSLLACAFILFYVLCLISITSNAYPYPYPYPNLRDINYPREGVGTICMLAIIFLGGILNNKSLWH